jgi:hypothetical protein
MHTIRDLFEKRIDRRIEEVIKVDQADEETVLNELQEYVLTESIGEHFTTVYKAIADAPSEPHEGIGIWVSGFFGSGKSSFAKIMGYTVAGRLVCGQSASEIVKDKAQRELPRSQAETLAAYLDVITANIPTQAIIFDVSMDRGVRTANERITEIMYKALLRALDYAEDFDLAALKSAWKLTDSWTGSAKSFRSYTASSGRCGANSGGASTRPVPCSTSSIRTSIPVPIHGPKRWAKGALTSRRTCWRSAPSSSHSGDTPATR